MNPQYISSLLLVLSGICISYGYYIRLKKKIIALKTFRDKQTDRIVKHFNAQIKALQEEISGKQPLPLNQLENNSNYKLHEGENNKQKLNELNEYNNQFKEWGLDIYEGITEKKITE